MANPDELALESEFDEVVVVPGSWVSMSWSMGKWRWSAIETNKKELEEDGMEGTWD
jgi:hypothetical protein